MLCQLTHLHRYWFTSNYDFKNLNMYEFTHFIFKWWRIKNENTLICIKQFELCCKPICTKIYFIWVPIAKNKMKTLASSWPAKMNVNRFGRAAQQFQSRFASGKYSRGNDGNKDNKYRILLSNNVWNVFFFICLHGLICMYFVQALRWWYCLGPKAIFEFPINTRFFLSMIFRFAKLIFILLFNS